LWTTLYLLTLCLAHPIKTEIPQGSTLGPLVFMVYINDLPQASNFITRLFADDTILLMSSPNLKTLLHNVNEQVGAIVPGYTITNYV